MSALAGDWKLAPLAGALAVGPNANEVGNGGRTMMRRSLPEHAYSMMCSSLALMERSIM
jgi:hypothetical protein